MANTYERLVKELNTVAMSDEASMGYTTVSPDTGRMHSCTVWFAPLIIPSVQEVRLFSLSAPGPARIHSDHIQRWESIGKPAEVSGLIREDGQKKNDPNCHGIAFHGEARTLSDRSEITRAIATFSLYNTFDSDNLHKYLEHSSQQIPTHKVFEFVLDEADVFDGRLGDDSPDRLARLRWPVH